LLLAGIDILQSRPPAPAVIFHPPQTQQVGSVLVRCHIKPPGVPRDVYIPLKFSFMFFVANNYLETIRKPGFLSHFYEKK
jgi:hypothetical protein